MTEKAKGLKIGHYDQGWAWYSLTLDLTIATKQGLGGDDVGESIRYHQISCVVGGGEGK